MAIGSPCEDEEEFIDNEGKNRDDTEEWIGKDEVERADGPDNEGGDDFDSEDLCVEETGKAGDDAAHMTVVNLGDNPEENEGKSDAGNSNSNSHEWIGLLKRDASNRIVVDFGGRTCHLGMIETVEVVINSDKC